MNTKTFNHFRNLFAFVGFFIIACSAAVDDSSAVEPPVFQSNNGKYQIEHYTSNVFIVLNTATGSVKTFEHNNSTKRWEDYNIDTTFTH